MLGSAPAASVSPTDKTAIFYVSDLNFVLPTLVSSLQVRGQADLSTVDIYILLTGDSGEMAPSMSEQLDPHGIKFVAMPHEIFRDFDHPIFRHTHVAHATLGRFFMLECTRVVYDHIIYLDGDTWISGNLRNLCVA